MRNIKDHLGMLEHYNLPRSIIQLLNLRSPFTQYTNLPELTDLIENKLLSMETFIKARGLERTDLEFLKSKL